MTTEQYRRWLAENLLALASAKYPNSKQEQIVFQLGFLQAQLATAMNQDNLHVANFKQAIMSAEQNIKLSSVHDKKFK